MIGVLALGGGNGQDAAEQDPADPLGTPEATSSTFSSTSRPSREALPQTATVPPTAMDPGARAWELPAASWEPLPTLTAPDEHWDALQQSAVNALPPVVLTGCPQPSTVTTEQEYRAAVRAQWDCVHAAWVPVYEALGWSTVTPAVEFYPGTGSKSECGYLEAPAFYCSAGAGTAYFGGDHLEMTRSWDLSVNEMVNHEYGHHIQSLAGITTAKQHVVGTEDVERRSELQATCWAAMMTYNNRSFDFSQEHYDSWQRRIETMLVDDVHGSRESLRYWGTKGLYATTLGDCNTWLVVSEHVS